MALLSGLPCQVSSATQTPALSLWRTRRRAFIMQWRSGASRSIRSAWGGALGLPPMTSAIAQKREGSQDIPQIYRQADRGEEAKKVLDVIYESPLYGSPLGRVPPP